MSNAFDYSTTPASNDSSPPDGAPEDCAPSAVNNIMRQMMANIAALNKVYTATGTGDAQVVTFDPAPTAWTTSTLFYFRPVAANTGSATISNGVSAKTLKLPDASTNLPAGYLQTSNVYGVWYDGTNAVIVSAPAIIESGSGDNGEYVRYADGTQICWHTLDAVTTSGSIGNVFFADAGSWTYPKAFSTTDGMLVTLDAGLGSGETWGGRVLSFTASSMSGCRGMGATNSASFTPQLFAIGRWY